ncbi:class I adenylate-forming enzyme family protein [Pelomonas sp. KK5]|uniref:class I adenylate-forming enzyme family protein n=1 Tax=Pelomonas sp. KK5 TaxID=1855730 RepID=UPI00097CB1E2|nr:AMP-binding protein [Pelomonas sp. KK5]
MNLARYVDYWAGLRADAPAAVFGGRTLSWGELNRQADAMAATLQRLGVAKGDRVGCLLDNRLEWPLAWCAAFKAGAILVPLNPRYGDFELREIAALVECRVIVSLAPHIARLDAALAARVADPQAVHLFAMDGSHAPVACEAAAAGHDRPAPVEVSGEDIAVITFTSGSTGLPKGAMLSHGAIGAVDASIIRAYGYTCESRVLLLAPFAFTGGVISVFSPAYIAGACTYIAASPDPEAALRTIVDERITALTGVPILWERMAASPAFEAADLGSMSSAATGGAPVPQSLLQRYLDKGVRIRQVYGFTEASGLISAPSEDQALAKPWACGTPLPSVQLRVVDGDGKTCPPGEVGEFVARGDQMFSGYWRNPEGTAEAWRHGWYHTGDLGRIDADGHVQVTDRKKNMVISGGVNIYPAEVERAMSALAGVAEVLAFGVPDADWGERLVAVVHGDAALAVEPLMAQCKTALGAYKTPKEILVSHEPLPRTSSGKVLRAGLPGLYERLRAEGRPQ